MTEELSVAPLDFLIVGAGLSGIGVAAMLIRDHPEKCWMIAEMRSAIGGTWDLFRYPGIRSDSDLHTFAYDFRPWLSETAIADGPSILRYLHETVEEFNIMKNIRFRTKVTSADFNRETALWRIQFEDAETGERGVILARWLFSAAGYYDYHQGHAPSFHGADNFQGDIIHPQFWPEHLDYAGKRVIIIGSGATAVTLMPEMAKAAAHVTIIQRTPTFIVPLPKDDGLARILHKFLPGRHAAKLTRYKNILRQRYFYKYCKRYPQTARRFLQRMIRKQLRQGTPLEPDFDPPYDPWDQRLCVAPDGDFFAALNSGDASIATAGIKGFSQNGVELSNGDIIAADLIVTATGLSLLPFGAITLSVDEKPVDVPNCVVYKGAMLSQVPNFAFAIGYTNSSWTLKLGLVTRYLSRLITHMDKQRFTLCEPRLTKTDALKAPLFDFGAGYVVRAQDKLPKQGAQWPWTMTTDYLADTKLFTKGDIEDGAITFSTSSKSRLADSAIKAGAAGDAQTVLHA